MKIALIVPGGVDRSAEYRVIPVLIALIERLAAQHTVHVFALHQEPRAGSWSLAGARIHNIGSALTRWRALRAICAEHRSAPFHVVQAVWSGAPGLLAVAAARLLGIPSVVHVAGGELAALRDIGYGDRLSLRGRLREAAVLRSATAVTAASAPLIATLAQLGIEARRLPLGVDLRRWPPREPSRRDLRQPARLIHVASLNRVKDQPTLLRALSALAASGVEFEMDIIGTDTLGGEIQALSERLGLSRRVRFHGFLTQQALRPVMEAADLLLLSSRHEAGPVVLLEAAVSGVPCVGTAVGHIAEWAPDAALAAPVADPAALAQAARGLLEDEDQRLRLARAAWQRAQREDAEHTARAFQALYAELTDRGVALRA